MSKEENVTSETTKNETVKKEEKVEKVAETSAAANQSIINTEAAKAKANEVAGKAKAGFSSFTEKMKTDKKFQSLVIGVAIIVVVVAVVLIAYLTGGSKGAIKGFAKAYVDMDAKKVVKYMHEDFLEASEDNGYDIEESLDDLFDNYDDNDYKFLSYEITDSEKVDKDDVEDIAEDLDENCDIKEKDVKAAVVYTIKFKVDDDGDKDTVKSDFTAVKIKSKWYIFPGDLS